MQKQRSFLLLCACCILFACERATTPEDLAAMQENGDWEGLVYAMKNDPNPLIRAEVPYYLGRISDPRVIPYLIGALRKHETMNAAATALANLKAVEALPHLIAAFESSPGDKTMLLFQIAKLSPEDAQPFLLQTLANSEWYLKPNVVECLAEYGNISAIPTLQKLKEELPANQADNPLADLLVEEIQKAIGRIQFRDQLLSLETFMQYGWKKLDEDTYIMPARVYLQKIGFVKAYRAEWYSSNDYRGFLFSEMSSQQAYYCGSGALSFQEDEAILVGLYTLMQKQDKALWRRMKMNLLEIHCYWPTRSFFFCIKAKDGSRHVAKKGLDSLLEQITLDGE